MLSLPVHCLSGERYPMIYIAFELFIICSNCPLLHGALAKLNFHLISYLALMNSRVVSLVYISKSMALEKLHVNNSMYTFTSVFDFVLQ